MEAAENLLPIVIGEKYKIRARQDGEIVDRTIEIVELLYIKETKNTVYYIHFDGFDRRLDQWVDEDWIRVSRTRFLENEEESIEKLDVKRRRTRSQIKSHNAQNFVEDLDPDVSNQIGAIEKASLELTKIKSIYAIQIGNFEIDTWYFSPYPKEFKNAETLYLCQFCLIYYRTKDNFTIHKYHKTCNLKTPPGKEVYRKGAISIWEIDGAEKLLYCQCLCLLSKLFLHHKERVFDINDFLFYVLCVQNDDGDVIAGYFSKVNFFSM